MDNSAVSTENTNDATPVAYAELKAAYERLKLDHQESERRLADKLEAVVRLQELSSRLIGSDDVRTLYEQMVEGALTIMHADCASLQMVRADGTLELLAWRNFHPESARFWQSVGPGSRSSCSESLRSHERTVVPDTETCLFLAGTDHLREFRRSGIRAVQSTPLTSRSGKLIGMISTHWRRPHQAPAGQLRLLDVLARQAADLVERTHAEAAVRASEAALSERTRELEAAHKRLREALEATEASRSALQRSERRLGAFYTSAMMGALYWTMDGRIEAANDKFLRMVGYTREDLDAGRLAWTEMTPPEYRELDARALADLKANGVDTPYEKEFIRKDGARLPIFIGAAMLDDSRHDGVAFVLDITDRKRAEAALREADRRKDEFIAILSHELRNPLAPIRYALPLLSEEPLGEGGRRAVAVIDRQAAHLARLVDDLLDVSRITAGKIELRRGHVTLTALVAAAVEAASPAIAAGRHSLDIAVPDDPVWLDVDATRISQAITNLLNNSAKYTPQGGRIRLQATSVDNQAVLRVSDNGIGIAPEALTTVFELFRQVSDPNRTQGGLGIGLTLTKQFVEMHGGTIEAHSAGENCGAEFVIRLPAAPAVIQRDEPQVPGVVGQPVRLRVLIVDDNTDLVDMLAMVVEGVGHDARKAFDGRSAVSAALEYLPHVILLDVGMPGMNGFEVATELRRHPQMARTRIVALTGWGQAEDRRRTTEAGFDDHLTKPTDPRQIQLILREVACRTTA